MKLFHLTAIVPDTGLHDAMLALEACKAYNVEVKTVQAHAPKAKAPAKGAGTGNWERTGAMYQKVVTLLADRKSFTREDVKKIIPEAGGHSASVGSTITLMLRHKLIKRTGHGQYQHIKPKTEIAA